MNENDGDLGAFLAGFVIGALVGAATALILAPQSGRATREQLAGISADIRHAGMDQIDHVRMTADGYTQDFRARTNALVTDTRDRAQHLSEQMQDQMRIVLDAGKENSAQSEPSSEDGTTNA
jgi:gas vesicle protein